MACHCGGNSTSALLKLNKLDLSCVIRNTHTSVFFVLTQNRFGHAAPRLNCTWTKFSPGIFCVGIIILPIKNAHGVRGYCICISLSISL